MFLSVHLVCKKKYGLMWIDFSKKFGDVTRTHVALGLQWVDTRILEIICTTVLCTYVGNRCRLTSNKMPNGFLRRLPATTMQRSPEEETLRTGRGQQRGWW